MFYSGGNVTKYKRRARNELVKFGVEHGGERKRERKAFICISRFLMMQTRAIELYNFWKEFYSPNDNLLDLPRETFFPDLSFFLTLIIRIFN